MQSILKEIHQLSAEGVKEIVLLGQNVNSYFDTTTKSVSNLESYSSLLENLGIEGSEKIGGSLADGFTELKRPKGSKTEADAESGVSFGELLFLVSQVNPEMRVRFQAPHPKGFPDDVLQLIAALPNVCNSLHMPAQHGSSSVLERMKRGYSAEAYRSLIARARKIIAGIEIYFFNIPLVYYFTINIALFEMIHSEHSRGCGIGHFQ